MKLRMQKMDRQKMNRQKMDRQKMDRQKMDREKMGKKPGLDKRQPEKKGTGSEKIDKGQDLGSKKIDMETIRHVASVARLELSEDELLEFAPQLEEVLEVFSRIGKVIAEDAEPSFQPVMMKNTTREDIPGTPLTQEEALKNSGNTKDGFFLGPKAV